jgi:hypothetical protein
VDTRKVVSKIKAELPTLALSNSAKTDITADIDQIEVEIERPVPRVQFLKLFMVSLRDNLAKAAGAATAGGVMTLVALVSSRGQTVAAINIGAPAAHVAAVEMAERYPPLLMETQKALRLVLH